MKNLKRKNPDLKVRLAWSVLGLITVRGLAAAVTATTLPVAHLDFRERYGVLAEHDIFMPDRSRHERQETPRSATLTPEQSFVLTGIVFEDGEYHAYMEDLQRSESMKLRTGDPIARGKIGDIQMDAVQYESPGLSTWIGIGNNLSGGEVESVSDARVAAAASGDSSTQPSTMPANIANLSIEERMKLRRMQELNH